MRAYQLGAAALILAAALAVRLAFLDVPVRYDEAFTFLHHASGSWRQIVSGYDFVNNQILHTLGVHAVWRLFGDAREVIRLPALLAGIALVPAAYAAGRELYGQAAALWSAALVAGFSPLVQYSTNARGYTLGALFFLGSVALGAAAVRGGGRLRWAGFSACLVASVYTIPSMAVGAAAVVAWLAIEALARGRRRALRDLALATAAAAVVAGALYLPTIGDAGWNSPYVPRRETLSAKWDLVGDVWRQWNSGWPLAVTLTLVAVFALALIRHRVLGRQRVPLAAVALLVALAAAAVNDKLGLPRIFLFLSTVYLITAAAGFAHLGELASARLRMPAAAANAALAVVAALALCAGVVARGEAGFTTNLPESDPGIAAFASRELPGQALVAGIVTAVPVSFDFRHEPGPGVVTRVPPDAARRHRVAVVVRRAEHESPVGVVTAAGGQTVPGARPRLLRHFRWIDVYEVRLAG